MQIHDLEFVKATCQMLIQSMESSLIQNVTELPANHKEITFTYWETGGYENDITC